jgi:hypothetical protein
MDPNIAKIIERTRARRAAAGTGETPLKIGGAERERSPLKPRNFEPLPPSANGSPRKVGGGGGSPRKAEIPDSPSDTVKRLLAGEDIGSSVRELISRQVSFCLPLLKLCC